MILTIKGLLEKEDYDELDSYIYQIEKGMAQIVQNIFYAIIMSM